MTARDLAERCDKLGMPLSPTVISDIETGRPDADGRRVRRLNVDELLVLAVALSVHPVDLLIPPDAGNTPYPFTPVRSESARTVRAWVRGFGLLPGGDRMKHLTEAAPDDYYWDDGLPVGMWVKREVPQWADTSHWEDEDDG